MTPFIQQLDGHTLAATVSGILDQEGYTAVQNAARELIAKAGKIHAMIILKDFEGFSRGVDWGNMDFYGEHADDILKMAIVGDPKWETQAYVFTGANARATEIKFFPPTQLGLAQAWITWQ